MEGILIENATDHFENVSRNATSEAKGGVTAYDARGAMLFTIATVCVYGLSIIAFIAGHTNRREHTKEEESQIHRYLKHSAKIRQEGIRDDVLRLRSQLLADCVMNHYGVCESTRRQSRVHRAHLFIDHSAHMPNSDSADGDDDEVIRALLSSENNENYAQKRRRKIGLAVLPEELPFIDENMEVTENVKTNDIRLQSNTSMDGWIINSNDSSPDANQHGVFVI